MSVPQVPRRPASSRRSSLLSPIHAYLLQEADRADRTATTMSAIVIGVELEDSDRYRVHDALPHAVVSALLGCVRSYDLIIRTAELAARDDAAAEIGARTC